MSHSGWLKGIRRNICLSAILMASASIGRAQSALPAGPAQKPFTAEPLPPGWDQIDERLVFLTIRLSSVEASIDAIDKAIKATGYRKGLRADDAEHARKGNEIMDRNGGGPVPWAEFYGRTAQDFYFHPGTSVQAHSHVGVGRQADLNVQHTDVPIAINRPPQLDYIYKANTDDQKRAEAAAAELGGKIDKLLERQRALESEQTALWCEIAFQAVASRDFLSKPLYRFDLKSTEADQQNIDHVTAAQAACEFVRAVTQLMGDAEKGVENDPASVLHQFATAISTARKNLNDRLAVQESILLDLSDGQSDISKVTAAAKRLDDVATNLDESFRLAHEGDVAGDDSRKNTFRRLLQDGLLNTADTLLTADQCVQNLVKDWNVTPDIKRSTTQADEHLRLPAINVAASAHPTLISPQLSDPIPAGSVWVDAVKKLVIISRDGVSFRAKYELSPNDIRLLSGTVRDGKISWLARDVKVVKGEGTAVNVVGVIHDDQIDIGWRKDNTHFGSYTLHLQPNDETIAPTPNSAAGATAADEKTLIALNADRGVYADDQFLKAHLADDQIGLIKGLHIGKLKLADRGGFTYFKLHAEFDNQSTQDKIEHGLSADIRILCVDAAGKQTVIQYNRQIAINAKGIQSVGLGDGEIYNQTIKSKNNGNEMPKNVCVSFHLGEVEFCKSFLRVPTDDQWWMNDDLIVR